MLAHVPGASVLVLLADSNSSAYATGYAAGGVCGTVVFVLLSVRIFFWMRQALDSPQFERSKALPEKSLKDRYKKSKGGLDKLLPESKVERKSRPTVKLLRLLGAEDRWFEPAYLKEAVEETFGLLQDCRGLEELARLKKDFGAECYHDIEARMRNKWGKDPLSRLDEFSLERIQFVHFSALEKKERHTFTALVTGYPERDDVARNVGWQEFWTFQRSPKGWKLSRLRAVRNSDALAEPNRLPAALLEQLKADPGARGLLEFVWAPA